MYFDSVEEYYDKARKDFIKLYDKKDKDGVMAIIDWLLWECIKDNNAMKAYEKILEENKIDVLDPKVFKSWMNKKKELDEKSYDKCELLGWMSEDEVKETMECDHLIV